MLRNPWASPLHLLPLSGADTTGVVNHDASKANTQKQAIERAHWNWPSAAKVFVSYDHGHDEELAETEEESMWDYTPSRSELE